MVFTHSRGFVLGAWFGFPNRSLRCRVLVCKAADTASLATWFLFGKLIYVATLVGFGEKRCRKNLPLAARRVWNISSLSTSKRRVATTTRSREPTWRSWRLARDGLPDYAPTR